MNADLRSIETNGMWKTPYPHGNKIIAALAKRDTVFSLWMDTDIVFVRPFSSWEYVVDGRISCSPATPINWGGDEEWKKIYAQLGMKTPDYRINLLRRRKKHTFLPYFNAGIIGFRDILPNGQRFGDLWYNVARRVDEMDFLSGQQRPYLDQMSLPPAIEASGCDWLEIEETHQYILGGRIRGKPLPDHDITAIHYRWPEFLREVNRTEMIRSVMAEFISEDDMRDMLTDPNWFA
jgi:hypothetical protein